MKLVVWGLGINGPENSGTTYLGIPVDDHWLNKEWEGNGFGAAHNVVRIELYNYSGHEVEIDWAFLWKDN